MGMARNSAPQQTARSRNSRDRTRRNPYMCRWELGTRCRCPAAGMHHRLVAPGGHILMAALRRLHLAVSLGLYARKIHPLPTCPFQKLPKPAAQPVTAARCCRAQGGMIPLMPVDDCVRPCRGPPHSSNGFFRPFRSWRVSLKALKLAVQNRLADWSTVLGTFQRLLRFQRSLPRGFRLTISCLG